jgi:hypothetical protein
MVFRKAQWKRILLNFAQWKTNTPAYHYKLELCKALSNSVFLADQRSNISNQEIGGGN